MPDEHEMNARQDDEMTKTKASTSTSAATAEIVATVRDKVGTHAHALREQAAAKAHGYAVDGKDKASDLLDGLIELVDTAIGTLDRNFGDTELGAVTGDYARRAAGALSGFNETLRDKDVDELLDEAKTAIRNHPAIAIGAAAALGFVLARIVQAGAETDDGSSAADIKL